jgi:protein involved in polysaccharide export with SLBB domain
MQRSVRASAIALCALATLTACEQNSSTEPQDAAAAPDAQPGAASNRDQTTAIQENPQVSSPESLRLSSSIGDLPPLSSRNLPVPRAQRAVPDISATLPIPTRSNWQPVRTALATPAPIQMPNLIVPGNPNSTVQSQPNLGQPNLGQPNLVPGQSANPFVDQPSAPNAIAAAAITPGSPAAIATATAPQAYSAQLVSSSQPLAQADAQPNAQPDAQPSGNPLTNAPGAESSATFSDLQGHWSQRIVSALANNGIVQGFTDGSFRPDQLITQAQFVAMAQKAFPDEAIQPETIQLRSGMTRASAAKAIYEALADQGRMPPLSTLVAAQPLTLPARQQPSALAALAAAPEAFSANPTASPTAKPAEASVTSPGVTRSEAASSEATSSEATSSEATSSEAIAAPTADQAPANQPANAQVSPAAPQSAPLTLATPQVVQPEVVQLNPVAPAAPAPNPSEAAPTVIPAAEPVAPAPNAAPNTQATETQPSSMVAVAITGEIIRPGAYNLSKADATNGQPTLMQAIQQAGGVTPSANIRQIQVRRTVEGSAQTLTVNLWQTLQAGDLSKDMVLQPGDTIAIPRAPETATAPADQTLPPASDQIQVSVVGEVNNPGRRELPPNASASQAILASGGFNQQAQQAELIRLNANGTVARRPIALDLLQDSNSGNLALQNDDVIFVQRSSGTATAMRLLPSSFTQSPLLGIVPF